MPKRTSYLQGTPNWVDLQTSDQAAAKEFYTGLFGWSYDDQPMEDSVYSMALIGTDQVAAIAPQPAEMAQMGVPPMWNTYLAVDSVDEAAARVEAAGGGIMMPAFDVLEAGRMTFVIDPGGAAVGLWQAANHIGATLVNEPGTVVWNELITEDPAASIPFYRDVFGLSTSTMKMGDDDYTLFEAGEAQVGGTIPPYAPGMPNHWHVYFAVADADATVAKATELGGKVVAEPFDTPVGRIAVLTDPQGATFSIMQAAGETS